MALQLESEIRRLAPEMEILGQKVRQGKSLTKAEQDEFLRWGKRLRFIRCCASAAGKEALWALAGGCLDLVPDAEKMILRLQKRGVS